MGLLNLASSASAWRGYEYYKEKAVIIMQKKSDTEYSGYVRGSNNSRYEVFIDLDHPRKSHCNCPYANGKRIICKHQIALFFSAFPKEAEKYYKEVIEYEEQAEQELEELYEKVETYIFKMKKTEAQQALYELLFDGPEWQLEKFVSEHWIE